MIYILKIEIDLRLIPFLIILDFMSISEFILYIFVSLLHNEKTYPNCIFCFCLLLGTFILKKKNIQMSQQASTLHSLIQPVDDILDASIWNT